MARLPTPPPTVPHSHSPTSTTHIGRRASDGDLSAAATGGGSDGSKEIFPSIPSGPLRVVSFESQQKAKEKEEDMIGSMETSSAEIERDMANLMVAQAALSTEWSRQEFRNSTYPDPSGMGGKIRGEQIARRSYPDVGRGAGGEEEINIQQPRPLLPNPSLTQLPLPTELMPPFPPSDEDRPSDQPGLILYQPSPLDSIPPQAVLGGAGPYFSGYTESSRSASSISPVPGGQQYPAFNQGYMAPPTAQAQGYPPFPITGRGFQSQPPPLPQEYMSRRSSDRPESNNSSSPNSYDYAAAGQFLYVDSDGRSVYGYPRAAQSSGGGGPFSGPASPVSSPSLGMAMEAGMPYGSITAAYYDSQDTGYGSPAWQGDQYPVYGGGNGRSGMGSYNRGGGGRGGGQMMGVQPQPQAGPSYPTPYPPYSEYLPYPSRGEYNNPSQWINAQAQGMQHPQNFSPVRSSFGPNYYGAPSQSQGEWYGPSAPYGQPYPTPDGRGRMRGALPRARGGGRFVTQPGRREFNSGWYAREGEYAHIGPGGQVFVAGSERPIGRRTGEEDPSAVGLGIVHKPVVGQSEEQGTATPVQSQFVAMKPVQRKEYHPQPPANRSEWVMWVGNVPSNVTHEEMWQFFTAPMNISELPFDATAHGAFLGIASIFLISRSSCGFVNLKSAEDLHIAIAYFNGRSLRPWDPQCPKLVCRIRKTEDDLRAGVGGQRGSGMHLRYIKEAKLQQQQQRPLAPLKVDVVKAGQATEASQPNAGSVSPSEGDSPPDGSGRRRESVVPLTPSGGISPAAFAAWHHDRSVSGSHSFASTNSSFLTRHFPKRFFILKSSTEEELALSVQNGTWRTQLHNEPVLDQAFRTSPEVFLVFGANRQGCFYGYALMRGAIRSPPRDRRSVSWSSKIDEGSTSSGTRSSGTRSSISKSVASPGDDLSRPEPITEEQLESSDPDIQVKVEETDRPALSHSQRSLQTPSDMRMASSSPREMTPGDEIKYPRLSSLSPSNIRDAHENNSAPLAFIPPTDDAEDSEVHDGRAQTLDPGLLAVAERHKLFVSPPGGEDFELDENAPERAKRVNSSSPPAEPHPEDGVVRKDMAMGGTSPLEPISEGIAAAVAPQPADDTPVGPQEEGHSFKIEWIKVAPLPFTRIRHLRNPWNQDKEIKVSRDGTEIEPHIAEQLLAEWDSLDTEVKTTSSTA